MILIGVNVYVFYKRNHKLHMAIAVLESGPRFICMLCDTTITHLY